MFKTISGVNIYLPAFKKFKSLKVLKAEPGKIFGHLSPGDEDAAYEELWNSITEAGEKSDQPAETD